MIKINIADHIGKKYGRLTILSQAPPNNKRNNIRVFVRCNCENTLTVYYKDLRRGNIKSCGCLSKDYYVNMVTHGVSRHPLYRVWYNIKERCYNPKNKNYRNYGKRKISVCNEWLNVKNFYDWAINNGWANGLQIDRKDNNGNYESTNCHFVTQWENKINKRNTVYVNYKGTLIKRAMLLKDYNISIQAFDKRIKSGWCIEDALNKPSRAGTKC